jgi:hypothetical protein
VVALLEALDGQLLSSHAVVFAGGTRIALGYGEYRVSRDIDFLAADTAGYASLRAEVREPGGVARLFSKNANVALPREPRIDQYGIRFPAIVDGSQIKVEFVAEGRIGLSAGVPGLFGSVEWASAVDCFTEKLLANSDRWADDAYLSRDLIDLAALRSKEGPIPEVAWSKAVGAYGEVVLRDLNKAAAALLRREAYRQQCFDRLDVCNVDELTATLEVLLAEGTARLGSG